MARTPHSAANLIHGRDVIDAPSEDRPRGHRFAVLFNRQHRRNRENMTSHRLLPMPFDRCNCTVKACLSFCSLPDRYDRSGLRSMSFFGNTQRPNEVEKKHAATSNSPKQSRRC